MGCAQRYPGLPAIVPPILPGDGIPLSPRQVPRLPGAGRTCPDGTAERTYALSVPPVTQ